MYFPLSPPFPLPLKLFLIAWGRTCVVNNIISFQLHSSLKSWLTFAFCFNIKRENMSRLANICFRYEKRHLNSSLLVAFVRMSVAFLLHLFVCCILFVCFYDAWFVCLFFCVSYLVVFASLLLHLFVCLLYLFVFLLRVLLCCISFFVWLSVFCPSCIDTKEQSWVTIKIERMS